jgi:TonB-dependent starch-binding outer membrane protein SusC
LTNNYDVGIDFGLFQNKISGSVAYFVHDINDMLLLTAVPSSSGVDGNSLWQNIGKMRNAGLEFEVNATPISKGGFEWVTSMNLTFNSNKILNLTAQLDRANQGLFAGETLTKKDGRVGAYYMAEYAGVDPEHGVEMIYEVKADQEGNIAKTGRTIPATATNMATNQILHEDKTGLPTYWGGVNNKFSYKGFDLNVFVTFQGGNYLYDRGEKVSTTPQRGHWRLRSDLVDNTWTQPGDQAAYPQLRWDQNFNWDMDSDYTWVNRPTNYNNESFSHDKFLHKGDFVRIRNIQLGYNLPSALMTKIGMQGLRIFVSGTNLFTFTQFKGYDPEVVSMGNDTKSNNLNPGIVGYSVPNLKTFTFGVNVKF